jgi:hypothetical protein
MTTVHEQTGIQAAAENRRRQGARFYAGSESVNREYQGQSQKKDGIADFKNKDVI